MALTDKKKKSNKKSEEKNSCRFSMITTKKKGKAIKNYISNIGESKNNFFMKAIIEKIERDTGKSFDELLKEFDDEQEEQNIKNNDNSVESDKTKSEKNGA